MTRTTIVRNNDLRGIAAGAPNNSREGRDAGIAGQSIVLCALVALLAGCASQAPPVGAVGHVRSYFGGVAADEPRAALVGRDVLSAGGSAADAVVAMGITMMVTRPDAAGAGGGGMCVVYDAKQNKAESIEFMPHAAATPPPAGRWVATVPGSFRGLFALHARYGQLRWEQLILPAERLARFGVGTPRVLARNLLSDGATVLEDSRGRAVFADAAGKLLEEGDMLRQVDLATTLGRIRIAGPGDFYAGALGGQFLAGVTGAGGWLSAEDMRSYRPRWQETIQGSFGNHDVHFLPSPALGGRVAATIWRDLGDRRGFSGGDEGEKALMLTDIARQAYAATLSRPRAESRIAAAGALAMDRTGNSAACVFTMNKPFGTGRMAAETGIVPAPPAEDGATFALSAMVVVNSHVAQSYMAATATGDRFAPVALMSAALRALDGSVDLESSLRAARAAPATASTGAYVEAGAAPSVRAALAEAGRDVAETPAIGVVNMMYCPEGIVEAPRLCTVRTDPRGFGYAINAEF
jgi:gamma-glutamyltranspeptidase / glutathione hydrolase